MATLILTSVGGAIGGPVGAALGAVLGQQVDATLFAPKPRHGPRLGELAVQTSSYGTAIPKLFGTMRVAGTVIWSTDLKEESTKSGGGKGRPKTVNYSYSASFAVALSGRTIRSVRRIWADGRLLRGAAGDFKSETGFRLYLGTESQSVDPVIAASEGLGEATAHRGIAYAVFEDFQLADYGNRIPSLTFEVEADPGPVHIGTIAETLSEGTISAGPTPVVAGYAASGDSIRSAIEALADIVPLSLADLGEKLSLTSIAGAAAEMGKDEQDARGGGGAGGRSEIVRRAAASVASEVTIAYHDTERDFQTGLQRASRGGPALKSDRRSLAAALSPGSAKAFAEARLAGLWAARETASVHLPPRRIGTAAGAHVRLDGVTGLWRVNRQTFSGMVVSLDLVRVPGKPHEGEAAASPGRAVGELDAPPWTDAAIPAGLAPDRWSERGGAVALRSRGRSRSRVAARSLAVELRRWRELGGRGSNRRASHNGPLRHQA